MSKLKLLVFGATRHTGYHVMVQALDAGHEITAIIRNPAAFTYTHPNLKVIKGDALQLATFEKEVKDKDVIISSLGIAGASEMGKPTEVCSKGVANMISAMNQHGVKRIICVSAVALDTNPKMGIVIRLAAKVLQRVLKYSYADMRIMETELKESTLNWTIIRPPKLSDDEAKGNYRIAVGEHLSRPWSIARADLAHYINHHLQDVATYQKVVEIAY